MDEKRFSLRDLLGQSYDQKDPTPDNNPIPQQATDNLIGSPISALLKAAQGPAPASTSGQAPLTPEQLQSGNIPAAPAETPEAAPAEKEVAPTIQAPRSAVKEAFQATQSPEQKQAAQDGADAKNPLVDTEMQNALNTANENRSSNASRQALFEMMAGIGSLGGKTMSGASGALDQAIKSQDQSLTDVNTKRDEYKKFIENKDEKEKNDPNSSVSKTMRDALAGMGVKIPDNATYAGMEKLAPQLMKNKEFQMKLEEMRIRREELGVAKQAAGNVKASAQQNAALTKTQQMLESMRGDKAVQQAGVDLYSAQKANELFSQFPDPNKIPANMVHLLQAEIGKIASGASPTLEMMKSLENPTVQAKMSKVISNFSNNPSPANAGAFLKQYKTYLDGMTDTSKKVIKEKYGRIINVNKSHLHPDDVTNLEQEYMHRFDDVGTPSHSSGGSAIITPDGQEIKMNSPAAAQAFKKDHPEVKIKGE